MGIRSGSNPQETFLTQAANGMAHPVPLPDVHRAAETPETAPFLPENVPRDRWSSIPLPLLRSPSQGAPTVEDPLYLQGHGIDDAQLRRSR